ncbi:MAG TPA: aminoacyl-tRNA hydrolase [Blastocatellia bacterium]|nr:aminoacyl-tRNA hydrolase [Blastocatellia bacterium]
MKLIAGLGNPGREYEGTWHNLGFVVIDKLMEQSGPRRYRTESEALVASAEVGQERVLLIKPLTFMNLSGNSVRLILERHGDGDPSNLVVVVDDVAPPLGMIRVRSHGSAGGHNGLKSIIDRLGTQVFSRVRLGIKPDHPVEDMARFVLSPVGKRDREPVEQMVAKACDAVTEIVVEGVERAMADFNHRVKEADEPSASTQ